MSTKISLYYNDNLHVYQECFDEQNVYIKKEDKDIEMSFKITIEDFVGICYSCDIQSLYKQAAISDETIKDFVQNEVARRQRTVCPFTQFHAETVYGSQGDPIEKQIETGVLHYTKKRDALKKLVEGISKFKTKYFFGLEDLL